MDSITNRIRRSLAMRGVIGTFQMCWYEVSVKFHPTLRNREARRMKADAEFDTTYGVDTGGIVRPDKDKVTGSNWDHGISYQAVDAEEFNRAMDSLRINHPDFVFVDLGSGKGRALLLAMKYPFKRLVGIEYCEELSSVAADNLKRYTGPRSCSEVELLCMDAVDYCFPLSPLVLFLFNPFAESVMERVAKNAVASYHTAPRRMIVVYSTPYFAGLWEASGLFMRSSETPAILDTGESLAPRNGSHRQFAGNPAHQAIGTE